MRSDERSTWTRFFSWCDDHIIAIAIAIAIGVTIGALVVIIVAARGEDKDREACLESGRDWSCRHDGYITTTNQNCNMFGKVMVCTPMTTVTPRTVCTCVVGKSPSTSP